MPAASARSAAWTSGSGSVSFASLRAAAASALPPPRPAATGIALSRRTCQRGKTPVAAASARSASRTIVSSGKPETPSSGASSRATRSARSTRCIALESSCRPSGRSGPTTSARLTFAGAVCTALLIEAARRARGSRPARAPRRARRRVGRAGGAPRSRSPGMRRPTGRGRSRASFGGVRTPPGRAA